MKALELTDWQMGAAANGRPVILAGYYDVRPGRLAVYTDRLAPHEQLEVEAVHLYAVRRLPERTQAFLFERYHNLSLDTTVTVLVHGGLLPPVRLA